MKNFIIIGALIISGTVPDYGFKLQGQTLTPSSDFKVLVNGQPVQSPTSVSNGSSVVVQAL